MLSANLSPLPPTLKSEERVATEEYTTPVPIDQKDLQKCRTVVLNVVLNRSAEGRRSEAESHFSNSWKRPGFECSHPLIRMLPTAVSPGGSKVWWQMTNIESGRRAVMLLGNSQIRAATSARLTLATAPWGYQQCRHARHRGLTTR